MKHEVKLIFLESQMRTKHHRPFTAEVDGIRMKGTVQFIEKAKVSISDTRKFSYRFYFGKDNTITEHPDYKDIRRQLLLLMIDRNSCFCGAAQVVK